MIEVNQKQSLKTTNAFLLEIKNLNEKYQRKVFYFFFKLNKYFFFLKIETLTCEIDKQFSELAAIENERDLLKKENHILQEKTELEKKEKKIEIEILKDNLENTKKSLFDQSKNFILFYY